jgi:hypothetical protein
MEKEVGMHRKGRVLPQRGHKHHPMRTTKQRYEGLLRSLSDRRLKLKRLSP